MLAAVMVLVFGQNLIETNYDFIKKDAEVNIYQSSDYKNLVKYTCTLSFISKDKIENPLDKNKHTIHRINTATFKLDNCELIDEFWIKSYYDSETKIYYYRMSSIGFIKPINNVKLDHKELALQAMSRSMSEIPVKTKGIKIDTAIPFMKVYMDGKIVDSPLYK